MRTVGTVLLVVNWRSSARVWVPAQGGRSVLGLLYLAAVQIDRKEARWRQGAM